MRNQDWLIGPAVVVGIGYPDGEPDERIRDFTPKVDRATLPDEKFLGPWDWAGGADAFLRFIETRVKPAVERRLPVDRGRQALFGHSFGGLFVLHALFTRPESFQVYVAGSPSLWWGHEAAFEDARAFLRQEPKGPAKRLLLTVGGLEDRVLPQEEEALVRAFPKLDPEELRERYRAYVARIAPVANCSRLFGMLREGSRLDLDVRFVTFPGEQHSSVIPAYLARGVDFMFEPPVH